MMIEMDAAQRRFDQQADLAIGCAWINATLQRAKKIPKLEELLRRSEDKGSKQQDLLMYLGGLKASLPSMTMKEWQAMHQK